MKIIIRNVHILHIAFDIKFMPIFIFYLSITSLRTLIRSLSMLLASARNSFSVNILIG